jgi:hypothetical protein
MSLCQVSWRPDNHSSLFHFGIGAEDKKSFMIFLPELETGSESTLGYSWSTCRHPCFQTDWLRTGNILSGFKNQVSEMIFIPEHQL